MMRLDSRRLFASLKTRALDAGGSSLLELVMVIIFLGVALVATVDMTTSGLFTSVDSGIMLTAVNLANEKLEEILADKNNKGYGFVVQQNYPVESNASGHQGFTRAVSVTDFGTYKEVQVRVTHPNIEDCVLVALLTNY